MHALVCSQPPGCAQVIAAASVTLVHMSDSRTSVRKRSHARTLRGILVFFTCVIIVVVAAGWAWQQPFMARARMSWELTRMPPPSSILVPVRGVRARQIADTFGAPRGSDRSHQGVDIFAARGTAVIAATPGIVASISERGLGGRQVWVAGPARQRHYYAHLEDWASGLEVGDIVQPGDVLGSVGDSGNARGTPTHLHYGIYADSGAIDPLPLMKAAAIADAPRSSRSK